MVKKFEETVARKESELADLHSAALAAKADELNALVEAHEQETTKFQLAGKKINALMIDVEDAREDARLARAAAEHDAAALAEEVRRSEETQMASQDEFRALEEELSRAQAKITKLEALKENEVAASIAETNKIRSENQALVDAAAAQHEQTLEFQVMLKKCMEKCKGFEQDSDEKTKMVRCKGPKRYPHLNLCTLTVYSCFLL